MHPFSDDARHQNPAWPDRAIAALADEQRTMITTAQLRELGVAPRTISKSLARGRLFGVHHGVHSLVLPRSRPRFAAEQAAILACGPSAVLSHVSAATLHGLRLPFIAVVHVTTVGAHRRGQRGIVVHRTQHLERAEHHRVERLPVTSVARTIIDLAPGLSDAQLEPLLDQALRKTSRTKIEEALARHPRRPGTPRLRMLLYPDRPSADTWSKAEARLRADIVGAGLPAPECNVPIGSYVADLLWREPGLIVEYDSYRYHSQPGAFHNDRTRHNDLETHHGYRVLHVTRRQVTRDLSRVIVWIALALAGH